MGWKKVLLGCFGIRKKVENSDFNGEALSSELSDPRNQALLPKPISGCRGVFIIGDNGVVEEDGRNTGSIALENIPADGDSNSSCSETFGGMTDKDAEFIVENRTMVWHSCGSKLLATANDTCSSEGSTDGFFRCSSDAAVEVTPMTVSLHPLTMRLGEITASAEDVIKCKRKSPERPIVASRKTKIDSQPCGQNYFPKCSADNPQVQSEGTRPFTNVMAAAAKNDVSIPLSTSRLKSISPDNCHLHKVLVPSLQDNPSDFWQVLRALMGQLGPILNPAGPKVTRPHNWETDGCICRYLFPRMTSEDCEDLSSRYTIHSFDSTATTIHMQELPLSQNDGIQ